MAQLTLNMNSDKNYTPSWLKVEISPEESIKESQTLNQWSEHRSKPPNFIYIWSKIFQAFDMTRSQVMSVFDKLIEVLKNNKYSPIKG